MITPHAVRWADRYVRNELDYSKWHWTKDAYRTICGLHIQLALAGTFLPETDERPEQVECLRCRALLMPRKVGLDEAKRDVAAQQDVLDMLAKGDGDGDGDG